MAYRASPDYTIGELDRCVIIMNKKLVALIIGLTFMGALYFVGTYFREKNEQPIKAKLAKLFGHKLPDSFEILTFEENENIWRVDIEANPVKFREYFKKSKFKKLSKPNSFLTDNTEIIMKERIRDSLLQIRIIENKKKKTQQEDGE